MSTEQTQGSLTKEAIRLAWPAVCESFFIALAGMVDTFMVSTLGANAVAAVGLTTQPKFLGLALFIAANVAISALVARRFGEKRQQAANEILVMTICFCIVAAVIISALTVGFADQIIEFCGSSEDTHAMAARYYRIIMGGMIFNVLSMEINAAQRGAGNTMIALRTNLISNLVNICGNYLLINGHFGFPALGITGAAIATVFGTVVACVMSIVSICPKDGFISIPYMIEHHIRLRLEPLLEIIKVGYSVFIEQVLMRIGFMSTAMMAAKMGTEAMAAHQVGMNILGLTFSFGDGMQVAAVALIGSGLCQLEHLGLLVIVRKGVGAGIVQRDADVADLIHAVVQMAGQLVVLHRGLAVRAVDHIQQGGVLHLQTFICLDGLQADAVGGVGVAVLVHHLLGITVGSGDLLVGQLTAQRLEAGIHSGQRFQRFLRFLGHIVAHNCGLAAVRVGGDGLFQEGFYVGGVLIGAGKLGGLLVSTVLCQ